MKFKSLYFSLYAIAIIIIASYIYEHPIYNWDVLPYMALAMEQDNQTHDDLHAKTYTFARDNFSNEIYSELTSVKSEYRHESLENSSYFHDNLDLYRVKPMYNTLVLMFYKIGIPLDRATILPGLIAFVGIGIILYLWLMGFTSPLLSVLFGVGVLALFLPHAMLSTPDAISSFFIVSAVYFYKENSVILLLIFLIVSVFIRIDNAVFASLLGVYVLYEAKYSKITMVSYWVVIMVIVGIIYMYLPEESGMLSDSAHLAGVSDYLLVLAKNIYGLVLSSFGVILILGGILLRSVDLDKYKNILWIIAISIILRMVIIPVHHPRFYIAYEIVFILIVLELNKSWLNKIVERYVS